MRIATWNVNSVRARLERVKAWMLSHGPDLLCLQETKCQDVDFPRAEFESIGYRAEIFGQKAYNGVAFLSREPVAAVARGFGDGVADDQARVIQCEFRGVTVLDLYVPNGSEVGSEKYAWKLAWLDRLAAYVVAKLPPARPALLLGDFNIAPDDRDVYDPEKLRGTILCSEEERARLRAIEAFGFQDLFRRFNAEPGHYTWWDFRGAMFRRGLGLRIDLLLGNALLAARCRGVAADLDERRGDGPSDHAPVVGTFDDA